ncbi:MAG: hypothetical protein NWS22_00580 [Porticoccaceae bacterium]|nr:MAG: hypothetical protein ABS23_03020 [SAR92 bacterium BACL16 MAG-120619-bin48]KRP26969.1 MAG: hypothetical protein ABS22_01465 [SAR92 bacterium BACL16 MAG-120322-bin99]MDP4653918.1 hypothetical protein [Alphaproteobacteria bacterium]MDP4743320.1 hypothetical protein [Porticoccaceae bacterium]MDP4752178.1 hypothetical protein [Porticoccaceae bacterium]
MAALSAQRITEEYERRQMEYPSIVIPLPLHWKKLTYRSFNQSQIIARLLTSDIQRLTQKTLNLRTDIAVRTVHGQAQHLLDRRKRLQGIRQAFNLRPQTAADIHQQTIAIVDDVVTTGASASALARTLLEAGVHRVDVWCIARTSWNKNPR